MTAPSEPEKPRKPYDLTNSEHDYPAREGPPERTILICTHPRSGSTLLGEAIYFAGGLGCPLEYFHRGFRPGLAERWGAPDLPGYIRAVHRHRTEPCGVLSVKLFWRDVEEMVVELDPARFADVPNAPPGSLSPQTYRAIASVLEPIFPRPQLLHLERRDRVRQAVSGLAANQTRLWRVIPEAHTPGPLGQVEYDFDRIDALIAYSDYCHEHWRNFFSAIGETPQPLTYEQLAADYAGTVRAVFGGLGRNAPVPPVRMRRQSDAVSEAVVLRYLRDRQNRAAG